MLIPLTPTSLVNASRVLHMEATSRRNSAGVRVTYQPVIIVQYMSPDAQATVAVEQGYAYVTDIAATTCASTILAAFISRAELRSRI